MKSVGFREPRIALVLLTVLLIIAVLFYCIASMITSVGYQTFAEAAAGEAVEVAKRAGAESPFFVILDPGHGGEDPGAVANGLQEKDLNLAVACKLNDFLRLSGFRTVMTRTTDRMLYNDGEEGRKKYFDLYNRFLVAESHREQNAVFVSIHMNKFPLESCRGLQIFYAEKSERGRLLAESLQEQAKLLLPENGREAKSDRSGVFLLKNNPVPTVIAECGFLSNPAEAELLADDAYQNRLAFVLYCGILRYTEEIGKQENAS